MHIYKKAFAAALCVGLAFTGSAQEHLKSLSADQFDTGISPKADFYGYVNKKWQDSHPLTPEYSRYGAFNVLRDSSLNRVQTLVLGLKNTNPKPGTIAYKVSSLYELGMDSVRRNAEGVTPIKPAIDKVQNAKPAEMEDLFIWMQTNYTSPFIGVYPGPSLANSKEYTMYVGGQGLGLGDRDYYLKDDARSREVLKAYKKLIVDQMMNAGFSKKEANRIMKNVLKIETEIAKVTFSREESRDIQKMYNPRTLADLRRDYPNIPWDRMFIEPMGIPTPENFIVETLNTASKGNELYKTLTDREKKDLYLWGVVSTYAPYLSDKFSQTSFEFNKVLSGITQQRPRWKRSLGVAENALGEAIGELYVEKYFPQSSKDYMINLVENLRTALGKHIINLPWMSDDTKLNAIKKLNAFTVKVGYPDEWKDYSDLDIDPKLSYAENVHNASLWAARQEYKKWGKPVDKKEWGMTPQTVNAYYNPLNNEIVFPAAILQAPFFDPEASDAENYGGIGVVIGHEMTHGFDDQGCQFDADGNMVNWWTEEDTMKFKEMTKGLSAQFSEVEVLPGLHANGDYTLGENIADQGGLRIARTAFLDAQKKKGVDINSDSAKIDGIPPMQVFYLNFANLWGENVRDEEIRNLTNADVHSLGRNRVNVTIRNIEPFFEAFSIKEGDPMFRPASERIVIW